MFCTQCRKEKLRREFPSRTLTDKCNHAPLHCLRCVTHLVRSGNKCSQCSERVTTDNRHYREFLETLERLFPETPHPFTETTDETSSNINQTISVVMLQGQCTVLEYRPDETICAVKKSLEERLGVSPHKQRLLYQGHELKTYISDLKQAQLQDYTIKPFSTLHLIILLYTVPDSLDHVSLDLFWGYPDNVKRDYLDASVLIYSDESCLKIVDYKSKSFENAVNHSGDVMDDDKRLGHHTINVKLKSLPGTIDKLFFTLSAWNSPNISKYKNPRMSFFDPREPEVELCGYQMEHASQSQAVILCSLSKIDEGWKVLTPCLLSSGNAKDYTPLKQSISERIIKENLC